MDDTQAAATLRPPLDAAGLSALLRPRILVLVILQTLAGYFLGRPSGFAPIPWLIAGTAFVSAAGCSLNHFIERDADARMPRTRLRPLVTGALTPQQVLFGGIASLLLGLTLLLIGCGPLAMAIQLGAALIYLGLYTPMKSRTSTNTWVGAIPGALPLIAGSAAAGTVTLTAVLAFTLVFLWQLPHFFAIASMYRADYQSGGMRMLSGDDPDDSLLRWTMPMQVMSVVLVSVLPALLTGARWPYVVVAVAFGLVFLMSALRFRARPARDEARGVVRASVLYLPVVLVALVLDTSCSVQSVDVLSDSGGEITLASDEEAECCDVEGGGGVSVVALDEDDVPEGGMDVASAAPKPIDDGTDLASYGNVPEFSLFDQDMAPFTQEHMLGDVWVVDFMFANCAGICIPMAQALVDMQNKPDLASKYLSITVDPSNDGPDVLSSYRERYQGDPDRWTLLTGNESVIHGLSVDGFHLPIQLRTVEKMEGMPSIFHSGKFALVDKAGRVRGFYSHDDRLELERLERDIAKLAAISP